MSSDTSGASSVGSGDDRDELMLGENSPPNSPPPNEGKKKRKAPPKAQPRCIVITDERSVTERVQACDPVDVQAVARFLKSIHSGRVSRLKHPLGEVFYTSDNSADSVVSMFGSVFGPSPARVVSKLRLSWFPERFQEPEYEIRNSNDDKLSSVLMNQMLPQPSTSRRRVGLGGKGIRTKKSFYTNIRLRDHTNKGTQRIIEKILRGNRLLLMAILAGRAWKDAAASTAVNALCTGCDDTTRNKYVAVATGYIMGVLQELKELQDGALFRVDGLTVLTPTAKQIAEIAEIKKKNKKNKIEKIEKSEKIVKISRKGSALSGAAAQHNHDDMNQVAVPQGGASNYQNGEDAEPYGDEYQDEDMTVQCVFEFKGHRRLVGVVKGSTNAELRKQLFIKFPNLSECKGGFNLRHGQFPDVGAECSDDVLGIHIGGGHIVIR